MRFAIALVAAAAAIGAAGAAAASPSVEIRDAVARVTVVPEDRSDIKVEMLTNNPSLPLEVRTSGATTVISGNLGHKISDCHGHGDHPSVHVRGVGEISWENMPQVVIHTPKGVVLESGGAVYGSVGRASTLEMENSGCSGWTVADVTGDVTLRESGAGSVHMGASGKLTLHLSGAGNVYATRVRQGLDATLSGVGGATVQELSGSMEAHVSGVGRVKVAAGHATAVHASVSGLGGVEFGGDAQSLDASISGIGNVRVKSVSGPVNKAISGGGHVTIG